MAESKWSGGGSGGVTPALSSTDNAVARFTGTSGSAIQNSTVIVDDSGNTSGIGTLSTSGKASVAGVLDSTLTASRAVASDGSKNLVSSTTTATELGYLSGVTSAIQTQLGTKGDLTSPLSQFAATTSLQLAGVISDETGSGALVFATSPTFITPILGAASATSISASSTITASNISGSTSGTNTGDQALDTLTDVVMGTKAVNDLVTWNGANWTNTPATTSVGAGAVDLYHATPITIAASANCAIALGTLTPTPVTTGDVVTATAIATNTVALSAWRSAALSRTSIPAGIWGFESHAGVNSTAGGRVTTITRNVYQATATLAGTITVTGSGTTRTVTATTGTPFATTNITASATQTAAAHLQTPQGIFHISARTSDTVITIVVPAAYTNETAVAFSTWQFLFGGTSAAVTSISPVYSQVEWNVLISSFPIAVTDSLGSISFGTSNNATTLSTVYNGVTNHSFMGTTFTVLHNELPGLNGGTSDQYYHLTSAEYTGTGTGIFARTTSPTITTPTLAGGTASNTSRWTVPSNTLANLTALTRVEGVIVYATDTDKFYSDDGTSLNEVGSGTGLGINYIAAPSTAVSAVWTRTGTTGAAGNAPATTTTAGDLPLSPIINTAIKILSATSAAAEDTAYVSAAFTTPATGAVKTQVSLFIRPGSNFIANEWTVSVYQSTTRQSLSSDSSSVTYIPNVTGNFNFTFDAAASTAYTLRIARTVNAGANAGQLNLAAVSVGPGIITQGAAVSDWTTYTPTGAWSANTTYTGRYRRVGDSMQVKVNISLAGAPTAATLTVNLPSGFTINTTAMGTSTGTASIVGHGNGNSGTVNMQVLYNNTTSVSCAYQNTTAGAQAFVNATTPITWAAAGTINLDFTVPIAEWAGNGTVNLGAGAQVEYVYNTGSTTTANGSNSSATNAYGPAGTAILSLDSTTVNAYTDFVCVFQYPIQADDLIVLELNSGSGWVPADNITPHLILNTSWYGVRLTVTNSTTVTVAFGNKGARSSGAATYAADGTAWSSFTSYKWRVRKAKASSPVGFGLAGTDGSSGLYKAGQAPGITTAATIGVGYIGETFDVTGTSSTLNAAVNLTSRAITAGTWLVYAMGHVDYATGTPAAADRLRIVFTTNSTASTTGTINSDTFYCSSGTYGSAGVTAPILVNISATTTYYLHGFWGTAASTGTVYGRLRAVRIG